VAVHLVTPVRHVVPDLKVPRMWPCEASGTGLAARKCGATPASLWRRSCRNGHSRDVRLCPSHAQLITSGLGACAECADRGAAAAAFLAPVDLVFVPGTRAGDRR
jgi:hypothetical protein